MLTRLLSNTIVPVPVVAILIDPSGIFVVMVPVVNTTLPKLLVYFTPLGVDIKVYPVLVDGVSPSAGCA